MSFSQSSLRRLDRKIKGEFSGLLKKSTPNPIKKHQLIKLVLGEKKSGNYIEEEKKVEKYYSSRFQNRDSDFFSSIFNINSYPWLVDQFILDFSNSRSTSMDLYVTSQNIRFHFLNTAKIPESIGDVNTFHIVVSGLVRPRWDEEKRVIGLRQFLSYWHYVINKRFGNAFDDFFESMLNQFTICIGVKDSVKSSRGNFRGILNDYEIEFSQTEISWMKAIKSAIIENKKMPKFPLSRGPRNILTRRLEALCRTISMKNLGSDHEISKVVCRVCEECTKKTPVQRVS